MPTAARGARAAKAATRPDAIPFSIDGESVFDETFEDAASALAGLDDALIELGEFGPSSDPLRTLVMSFELELLEAPEDGAFGFDFALLAKSVPEPTAGLLLVVAAAALLAVRRARSD